MSVSATRTALLLSRPGIRHFLILQLRVFASVPSKRNHVCVLRGFWGYGKTQGDGHSFLLGVLDTLELLSLFSQSFLFIFTVTFCVPL
jgi:hypothetical protein